MALFFYGFATLMIFSSIMVIASRNTVHSVLWLIFTFCNCSGLMVLMGAEFLAMMLIVIYVGAVAVLFLFVVMMLDIKISESSGGFSYKNGTTLFMSILLLANLLIVIMLATKSIVPNGNSIFTILPHVGNVYAIGNVLYTNFIVPFQICGLILFVAMIASISLTLRLREGVKRQNLSSQIERNKENSLILSKEDGKLGLRDLNYDD